MTELCDLGWKYRTDKTPKIKHHFTEFYHEMFKDRREKVEKVVEIGVGRMAPHYQIGASLYMWREYFPNAMIYGLDNDPELIFCDDRIECYPCDQTDVLQLETMVTFLGPNVDLFIDDGLHTPESQIATCRTVMPLLDKDAIYSIEDAAHANKIVQALQSDYNCKVLRHSHIKYQDDRMVIVRHR